VRTTEAESRARLVTGQTASLADLVRWAGEGDRAAWNEIVDRYAGIVWAIARRHRLSAADAADVSQTTWLRLVEHLDRIENPERIGAWLATTARHESLRVLRLAGRQIPALDDDFAELADARADTRVDAALLTDERDRELRELVAALPARDQLLLQLLSHDAQPSYVEIGAALGMPTGSIGPTRARCLERLRRVAATRGINLAPADS